MSEDLIERLRVTYNAWNNPPSDGLPSDAGCVLEAAAEIERLRAKLAEVGADRIVAPAECDENCDDPDCPYNHVPLTLQVAYENSISRMRWAEARAQATEAKLEQESIRAAKAELEMDRLRAKLAGVEAARSSWTSHAQSLREEIRYTKARLAEAKKVIETADEVLKLINECGLVDSKPLIKNTVIDALKEIRAARKFMETKR